MKIFDWPADRQKVERFFRQSGQAPADVEATVAKVLKAVAREGDRAVARFTKKFDRVAIGPEKMEVKRRDLERAFESLEPKLRSAMQTAARRIKAFHRRQKLRGWVLNDARLGRMEMRVQAVERAGVYAPGGKAAYPSTVLMDVIPARVAGVREIVLTTPPGADGPPDRAVLAAAWLAGVDRVFRVGGAQAIAALAYGTRTIPRVDTLVGPGNIYVATAKRMLFGRVNIDSIAGPTEVLILADAKANVEWVAADMLAQAEHDEDASAGAVLIGCAPGRSRELVREVRLQLRRLPHGEVAAASIRRNGYMINVANENQAVEIANSKAPEHLQIMTKNARGLARRIKNAGAIFVGGYTPEPVGDYIAGPNHTLPTGGTARFFSPLSVWTFYKTSHTIEATRAGLARHAEAITTLAESEGLPAHAESVRARFKRTTRNRD